MLMQFLITNMIVKKIFCITPMFRLCLVGKWSSQDKSTKIYMIGSRYTVYVYRFHGWQKRGTRFRFWATLCVSDIKLVSPVIQSTSPVHQSNPPIVYTLVIFGVYFTSASAPTPCLRRSENIRSIVPLSS